MKRVTQVMFEQKTDDVGKPKFAAFGTPLYRGIDSEALCPECLNTWASHAHRCNHAAWTGKRIVRCEESKIAHSRYCAHHSKPSA